MRRYALPLAVALTAAVAACSGGGSVLSTGGSATNILITDANQSGNQLPSSLTVREASTAGAGAGANVAPLVLHAQAVTGNGTNGVTNGIYKWAVSGPVNSAKWSGGPTNNFVACNSPGTVTATGGANTIGTELSVVPSPQTTPTATQPVAYNGYSLPAGSIQVNPQDTSLATFTPPGLPTAPAGFAFYSMSYCAVVTVSTGNAVGSAVVLVTP